ncbi:hypothetical protein [Massilia soli]|uniref:Uncharacterized protein n=1 Tax=Massilia soli TaxID=2792854 RepID=A0ABS7SRX9_9BURK|nr:hypothetical protein [Massilia soli]MBZ2208692.1 hypothetical protein [Massilia soli]
MRMRVVQMRHRFCAAVSRSDRRCTRAHFAHCTVNDDAGPSKTTITFHDGSTGLNQFYFEYPFNLRHLWNWPARVIEVFVVREITAEISLRISSRNVYHSTTSTRPDEDTFEKSLISTFDFRKKTTAELDRETGCDQRGKMPGRSGNPSRCASARIRHKTADA